MDTLLLLTQIFELCFFLVQLLVQLLQLFAQNDLLVDILLDDHQFQLCGGSFRNTLDQCAMIVLFHALIIHSENN